MTIRGIPDTWIHDLTGTESAFLHFFGTKMTNFFWSKNSKNFGSLRLEIFSHLQWNRKLPSGLLDIYFMNREENLDFATAGTAIFAHYQIRSKTSKIAKKPQKRAFLANLSVSAKNFSAELRFDRFWSHSAQKKSVFGSFQNFQDFTVVKGPYPKSGPLCPYLTKKNWSNGISIS